jgi:hypothetical protein
MAFTKEATRAGSDVAGGRAGPVRDWLCRRRLAGQGLMGFDLWLASMAALGVLGYLIAILFVPEKF